MKNSAILLLQCRGRGGLEATIANFIYWHGGEILNFEQHLAGAERFYLARIEWDLTRFEFDLLDFPSDLHPLPRSFQLNGTSRLPATVLRWPFLFPNTITVSSIFSIASATANSPAKSL